jgi:hypothetical protein
MSRVGGSIDANSLAEDDFGHDHAPGSAAADPARPASARAILSLVRAYQMARSGRPTGCRYLPSCSEYAVEAIDRHGAGHGTWLAVRRISRCGPWGGHGIDPVPERSTS